MPTSFCSCIARRSTRKICRRTRKNIAEVIIGKQRNGPVGTVKVVFLPQYARLRERRGPAPAAAALLDLPRGSSYDEPRAPEPAEACVSREPAPDGAVPPRTTREVDGARGLRLGSLSSVAYATEEILLVLVLAGTVALSYSLPISIAIAILIAIVVSSYRQTIRAYPQGGGAYIVSKDNLGVPAGLVAGAALLIDYVLTVAVSVAAGIAALTSAVPALFPYRPWLCVVAVVGIAVANLRGIRESGKIFAAPTYLFIGSLGVLIIYGGLGAVFDFLPEAPYQRHPPGLEGVGLLSVLARLRVGLHRAHRGRGRLRRRAGVQAAGGAQRADRADGARRDPDRALPRHHLPGLRLRHRAAARGDGDLAARAPRLRRRRCSTTRSRPSRC